MVDLLEERGVKYISTPYDRSKDDPGSSLKWFGFDGNLITVDRGRDFFPWDCPSPDPLAAGREVVRPVVGMHWPAILHADPERNSEVVDRWVDFLRPYGSRVDTMLSPCTAGFCAQLVYCETAALALEEDRIWISFAETNRLPGVYLMDRFTLKFETAGPVDIESDELEIVSLNSQLAGASRVYEAVLRRSRGLESAEIRVVAPKPSRKG